MRLILKKPQRDNFIIPMKVLPNNKMSLFGQNTIVMSAFSPATDAYTIMRMFRKFDPIKGDKNRIINRIGKEIKDKSSYGKTKNLQDQIQALSHREQKYIIYYAGAYHTNNIATFFSYWNIEKGNRVKHNSYVASRENNKCVEIKKIKKANT